MITIALNSYYFCSGDGAVCPSCVSARPRRARLQARTGAADTVSAAVSLADVLEAIATAYRRPAASRSGSTCRLQRPRQADRRRRARRRVRQRRRGPDGRRSSGPAPIEAHARRSARQPARGRDARRAPSTACSRALARAPSTCAASPSAIPLPCRPASTRRRWLEARGLWDAAASPSWCRSITCAPRWRRPRRQRRRRVVYASDAAAHPRLRVALIIAGPNAPAIVYPARVVSAPRTSEAAAFVAFLRGPRPRRLRAAQVHRRWPTEPMDTLARSPGSRSRRGAGDAADAAARAAAGLAARARRAFAAERCSRRSCRCRWCMPPVATGLLLLMLLRRAARSAACSRGAASRSSSPGRPSCSRWR